MQIADDLLTLARFHVPDAGVVADPAQMAAQIIELLDEAEVEPSGFIHELAIESLSKHLEAPAKIRDDGRVDLPYTLQQLDQALPKDRVLVTDGGRFMTEVWCRISATDPQHFISGTDFGSIGLGLQTAIGMGFGALGRPVCLFSGDGGFMMGGLTEFNTAVRMGLDLIVIICNDAAYGAEHIQLKDRGMDPASTEFDWPSFAQTAVALGGAGVLVQSNEDLARAIEAINQRQKPLLIELRLDPNDVPRMRK